MTPQTTTQAAATDPGEAPLDARGRIAAIVAGSAGNFVEWFDFFTYASTSLYFAAEFFPRMDRTAQLLNTAGIFAAGFLVRPLGGWFFGRYADRRGRRAAMLLSVLLMCAGSLAIALLPTYATAGALAPALLLAARLVQGFSLGGEYGASATYLSEVAVSGRRGFFASFQYVTLIAGQLAAMLVVFVLQRLMSEQALRDGGWRIPFLIGAVLALTALWLRRSLRETAVRRGHDAGTLRSLAQHWPAVCTVLGLTAAGSLGYYTFATYMQKYLVNTTGLSARDATAVMTAALLVYMLVQPLFGSLSDRLGRRTMLVCWAALGVATTLPLLNALAAARSPAVAFLLVTAALLVSSFYTSVSGLFKAELFPMEVRALGVGFPYAVGNAIFGGSAEYVALLFKQSGHEVGFYWYVTAIHVVALATSLLMRDLRQHGTLPRDRRLCKSTA